MYIFSNAKGSSLIDLVVEILLVNKPLAVKIVFLSKTCLKLIFREVFILSLFSFFIFSISTFKSPPEVF